MLFETADNISVKIKKHKVVYVLSGVLGEPWRADARRDGLILQKSFEPKIFCVLNICCPTPA